MTTNAPGGPPSTVPRHIEIDTMFNLRDLGGHPTSSGGRVKRRHLYRGASLHRLAGADADAVRGLGARIVIDLRTAREVLRGGGFPPVGGPTRIVHLPMMNRLWKLDGFRADDSAERFLAARYEDMLVSGARAIGQTLRLLADPSNLPLLFFCTAGKDRTGVLAAIVLAVLGVADEDIAEDYSLSREPVARLWAHLQASGRLSERALAQPAGLRAAPPMAVHLFLERLRSRHGSVEAFVRRLGVDDLTLERVRGNLVHFE